MRFYCKINISLYVIIYVLSRLLTIHTESQKMLPICSFHCILKVKVTQSCLTLFNPMDQFMEFSKPEYWSGQPFPSPGDLPNPRIEPRSPALQADSLPAELPANLKNILITFKRISITNLYCFGGSKLLFFPTNDKFQA